MSRFEISGCDDQDIIDAYDWFRSFLTQKDWLKIKGSIENYLEEAYAVSDSLKGISEGKRIVVDEDKIGWYLYLVYAYIHEPIKYEYFQGARILPVFKRIGSDLQSIKKVTGIEKRVRDLLRKRPSEADAVIFEILTGSLWVKNGWEVNCIEERQGMSGKTPDFLVTKGNEFWQVECKRQSKTSDYANKERLERLAMISEAHDLLIFNNIFLEITFHVELSSLASSYLKDIIRESIPRIGSSELVLETLEAGFKIRKIDIEPINRHLENYFVKQNSPQMQELIAGKTIDHRGFTTGVLGESVYIGEGTINNKYYVEISNAFGVVFDCDADASILAKARDIKKQVSSALKQFDPSIASIIHIGLETFDGPEVERARLEKILKTFDHIDPMENTLCWVFCHYFQSYTRSHTDWYYDETVQVTTSVKNSKPPLTNHFLVIPQDDIQIVRGSHWERGLPF